MNSANNKIKVLVNSIPLAGHYIPLVRIAEELVSHQEFSVTFSTSDHEISKISSLGDKVKRLPLQDKGE